MQRLFRNKFFSSKISVILLALLFALLIFVRVYNIDVTARFTQDESSDLVRMHEYYKSHKLTLVGPISNDRTKVFSSLTYYMLMPFAAVGSFSPISPAYGTAFWGFLTALLLLLTTQKVNKKLLPFAVIITLFWYPLLQTSRWAWNPHLVVFWISLGIWFYLRKTLFCYFLSGIFFGLAFHSHYIALIATGIFVLLGSIIMLVKKEFKKPAALLLGYILPFVPFVLFDLRHPPGLFITRYLTEGNIANTQSTTLSQAIPVILENIKLFLFYLTQNDFLAATLGITLLIILWIDVKINRKYLLFALPVVGQLITGAFLDSLQTRYLLPAVIFLFVWLIFPRKSIGALFSKAALLILAIGSLLSFYPQLHFTEVQPDIRTIIKADEVIIDLINSRKIQNANIAALGSEATDTFAINLRDALQIHDVNFLAVSQYDVSEQLLVLSTSDEKSLRRDQSFAMQQFKNARLGGLYPLTDSDWKIYWFKKI